MQQGLTESLAGRFEIVRLPHWSFDEMRAAFGFSLEEFLVRPVEEWLPVSPRSEGHRSAAPLWDRHQ